MNVNMVRPIRSSAALAVTMAMCGCRETTPSDYVRTGQITALVEVTAESEAGATVQVELRAGGADSGTFVVLHEGDELHATGGAETREMRSVREGVYEAKLVKMGEGEVRVNFDRAKHQDAPASVGTLPAPFIVVSPAEAEELSRAEDAIVVAWSPAPEAEGRVELSGPCIEPFSIAADGAEGEVTIAAGEIASDEGDEDETCDVEIVIKLGRRGAADPALHEESRVDARQVRRRVFASAP